MEIEIGNGDGCEDGDIDDSVGADMNGDGQLATFFSFFFQKFSKFQKKSIFVDVWVGQIWPFFILSFSHV